jgi:hypothetical protein
MQKVRKGLYLGFYIVGILCFWFFATALGITLFARTEEPDSLFVLIFIIGYFVGIFLLMCAIVAAMMLVHKMWAAIEGPSARTTPGKAVGFLFLPVFNLYWGFVTYWGWTKDYNKLVSERQINAPLMSTGLGMTLSIFHLLSCIPYIGLLFVPVHFILMIIFLSKACNRINALCDAGFEPQPTSYPVPNADAKTSGMAIGSLICGIFGFITGGLTAIAGLILGICGLNSIKNGNGQIKGRGLAVSGIIVSSIMMFAIIPMMLAILMPALGKVRQLSQRIMCSTNLSELGKSMYYYSNDDAYGRYPSAENWCDLLIKDANALPEEFKCVGAEGKCNYAINENVAGLPDANLPADMVVLFETEPGWNQHGGREILSVENHQRDGCNVMFNDGSCKFIKTEDVDSLRWK